MSLLLDSIFTGVATGMIFGAVALALAVIHNGTGVMNLAQGELAVLSAYLCWQFIDWGVPFAGAALAAAGASFVIGCLVERVVMRRLEGGPVLNLLIVTTALFFAVQSLIRFIWGNYPKQVPNPFGTSVFEFGGAYLTAQQIGIVATTAAAAAAFAALLRLTPLGLKLRAAAANPDSARYLGVNVGGMQALSWGLASVAGASAGIASAPITGVAPEMMSSVILMAFAAMIIGGINSLFGAVFGGVMLGITTNLAVAFVPFMDSSISSIVPFIVILLVLLFRPHGLFGTASAVRA